MLSHQTQLALPRQTNLARPACPQEEVLCTKQHFCLPGSKLKKKSFSTRRSITNDYQHTSLRRHRFLMGRDPDPYCQQYGEEQTAEHLLTTCIAFVGYRCAYLGKPIIRTEDNKNYNINKILKICKTHRILNPL